MLLVVPLLARLLEPLPEMPVKVLRPELRLAVWVELLGAALLAPPGSATDGCARK